MRTTIEARMRAQEQALVALARDEAFADGSLDGAARSLARVACETLGVARAGLWLLTEDSASLRAVAIHQADTGTTAAARDTSSADGVSDAHAHSDDAADDGTRRPTIILDGDGRYRAALESSRAIALDAVPVAGDGPAIGERYFAQHGIGAALDAGVCVNGALAGLVRVEHRGGPRAWTMDERAFAASLADLVVPLLRSKALRTAERALQRQQMDFMAVIEQASDIVSVVDEEGVIQYQSPSAERWLGFTRAEVVGREVTDFTHPDDLEHSTRAMETMLRGRGRVAHVATRIRHKDGSWRRLESAGHVLSGLHNGRRAVVLIARDVTERSEAAQALRHREAYFRALIEGATDIIAVLAADSTVTYVNQSAERLLGFAPEDVTGRPFDTFVPAAKRAKLRRILARSIERPDRPLRFAFELRAKDGRSLAFDVQGKALPPEAGLRAFLLVARDVTDRKEAERRLQEREEQLHHAQKMEAVGRLGGGVAHDFNNLLQAIGGYAELLARASGLEEGDHVRLEGIRDAVRRATSLTRQLLAFSRRQVLQPTVLDLNEVVSEIGGPEGLAGRLVGEDITIELELASHPIVTRVDRGQLDQVLMNLVVNARDAMPEGGRIALRTDVATLGEPVLPSAPTRLAPGTYARIVVTDDGSGMDGATRVQALEPFFTTKARGKGTGLGLSTAYGIVTQSGGDIRLTSQLGRGTAVEILLPRTSAEPSVNGRATETRSARGPEASGETILVVEDDDAVRELAAELLRADGYVVRQADSGAVALRLLAALPTPPRLLVTDVVMPRMNGRELAEAARATVPHLRVLFLSGYGHDVVARHGVLEDGMRLLAKPFSAQQLSEAVHETIHAPASNSLASH